MCITQPPFLSLFKIFHFLVDNDSILKENGFSARLSDRILMF